MLSDILSGRAGATAIVKIWREWVGVHVAWLEGDDRRAPEWALPPLGGL